MRYRSENANSIVELFRLQEGSHRWHLAVPWTDHHETDVGMREAELANGFCQKLQCELFTEAHVTEENAGMPTIKFFNFVRQRSRCELYVVSGEVRDGTHQFWTNSCRQQRLFNFIAVAINLVWDAKQEPECPKAK